MGSFAALLKATEQGDLTLCCQLLHIIPPKDDPQWLIQLHQAWLASPQRQIAHTRLCWRWRKAIQCAPLPAYALLALLQWYQANPSQDIPPSHATGRRWLVALLACSQVALQRLTANPTWGHHLLISTDLKRSKPLHQFQQDVAFLRSQAESHGHLCNRLRRYRMVEWCRIVGRMAAKLADQSAIELEFSHLAQAIVGAMLQSQWRRARCQHPDLLQQPARLLVVAQGKLGSWELNVSSDIDIQWFVGVPHGLHGPGEILEPLTSMVQQLVANLSQHNQQDLWCYRVDGELRPGGRQGPLVSTIPALEQHFSTLGQTWERLAWLRSRPLAGPTWLWQQLKQTCDPFVFSPTQDPMALQAMAHVRKLAHAALPSPSGPVALAADIKRQPGGIRDIELYTHILQVLHGHRHEQLTQPHSIPKALSLLAQQGIISLISATQLQRAYRWLRRCEHWLQAWQDRQTYTLPPPSTQAWYRLATCMGLTPPAPHQPDPLAHMLHRLGQRVRYRCTPKTTHLLHHMAVPIQNALYGSGRRQHQALEQLGFRHPQWLSYDLGQVIHQPTSLFHPSHSKIANTWLLHLSQTPKPDMALLHYLKIEQALWRKPAILYALRQSSTLRHQLADILSASPYLSEQLYHYPDAIAALLPSAKATLATAQTSTILCQQVWRQWHQRYPGVALQRIEQHDHLLHDWLDQLHALRQRQTLLIGLLDLTQQITWLQVMQGLSQLAYALLQLAMQTAEALTPTLPPGTLAVVALGRLGAGAMAYGSDVDLLFVYDGEQDHCPKILLRRAQHLITLLTRHDGQGALYKVDTQLRPNGRQGPLCCSLAALEHYHRHQADVWERLALISARVLTGHPRLVQRLKQLLHTLAYAQALPKDAGKQLQTIRHQQLQASPANAPQAFLKWGPGGLMDLTCLVQWLQIRFAPHRSTLATPSMLQAIDELRHVQAIPRRDCRQILASYLFLRRLELRLRLLSLPEHHNPVGTIDPLQQVALYWHRPISREQLALRGQRHQQQVERLYQRWLIHPSLAPS